MTFLVWMLSASYWITEGAVWSAVFTSVILREQRFEHMCESVWSSRPNPILTGSGSAGFLHNCFFTHEDVFWRYFRWDRVGNEGKDQEIHIMLFLQKKKKKERMTTRVKIAESYLIEIPFSSYTHTFLSFGILSYCGYFLLRRDVSNSNSHRESDTGAARICKYRPISQLWSCFLRIMSICWSRRLKDGRISFFSPVKPNLLLGQCRPDSQRSREKLVHNTSRNVSILWCTLDVTQLSDPISPPSPLLQHPNLPSWVPGLTGIHRSRRAPSDYDVFYDSLDGSFILLVAASGFC